MEELRKLITASIRRLDEHLVLREKLITTRRHRITSNSVFVPEVGALGQRGAHGGEALRVWWQLGAPC